MAVKTVKTTCIYFRKPVFPCSSKQKRSRTVLDDMLVAEHEADSTVLDAQPVVQNFEVFAERLLVVAATDRYLKHLPTADQSINQSNFYSGLSGNRHCKDHH